LTNVYLILGLSFTLVVSFYKSLRAEAPFLNPKCIKKITNYMGQLIGLLHHRQPVFFLKAAIPGNDWGNP
jgi:hypothetical protein